MKVECLHYILDMTINSFMSKVNQDQIEKYKGLYPNIEWNIGFKDALKKSAKNKTCTESAIEGLYKFMKEENLLGDFG